MLCKGLPVCHHKKPSRQTQQRLGVRWWAGLGGIASFFLAPFDVCAHLYSLVHSFSFSVRANETYDEKPSVPHSTSCPDDPTRTLSVPYH